jgi:RNA polymerase sigma-70 factor, ECF subfamily
VPGPLETPLPFGLRRVVRLGIGRPSEPDSELAELVASARRGDRDAFGRIFDAYHLPIYRYVLARLRSATDAEDVAAEVFVAAFRTIGRFRWQGRPFEAWLFRIARSKILDHQRSALRRAPMTDLAATDPAHLPSTRGVVTDVLEREDHAALIESLHRLSAAQQDVVTLRFFGGLSVRDTAAAMGRSESAVKQLQLRAISALRDRLGPGR